MIKRSNPDQKLNDFDDMTDKLLFTLAHQKTLENFGNRSRFRGFMYHWIVMRKRDLYISMIAISAFLNL